MSLFSPGTRESPIFLAEFCGEGPKVVRSPYSSTDVLFKSGPSRSSRGSFNITYKVNRCGGVGIAGPLATLQSPNYPGAYGQDVECLWILEYPEGDQIEV